VGWSWQKCELLDNLQVHHKIKRSQLGHDFLDNLVTLCAYCYMGGSTGSFSIQSQSIGASAGLKFQIDTTDSLTVSAVVAKAGYKASCLSCARRC